MNPDGMSGGRLRCRPASYCAGMFQSSLWGAKMNRYVVSINKKLEATILHVIAICFAGLVIAVTAGVATRYFSFGTLQWQWPEEVSRLLLVWLVFLSSIIGCIHYSHLKIDYFFFRLNDKTRNVLYVFILLLVATFLGFVTAYGVQVTRMSWSFNFAAFDLSQGYMNLALPVCGVLMFYFTIIHLVDFLLKTYSHKNTCE